MRMTVDNIIEYSFFEKPTASNRCLQEDTALNHNSLIMSLSNEVGRRLDNFSSTVPVQDKVEALDVFSQKMINSGHSVKTVRTIMVGGIKGFLRSVARSMEMGEPLHRSSSRVHHQEEQRNSWQRLNGSRRMMKVVRRVTTTKTS